MPIEFALDSGSKIPPKSQVGNLAAEIADEGFSVSEGVKSEWKYQPDERIFPDLSKVKNQKIAKYFHRGGFDPWPSYIYHPTQLPRVVKDAEEALEYGIIFRDPTPDERSMGQGAPRYDFIKGTEWRVKPFKEPKFDHTNPGPAKNYESPRPDYQRSQTDLLRGMVAALQEGNKGSGLDADTMAKAMVMAMELMERKSAPEPVEPPIEAEDLNEREHWLKAAEERGVKVDRRWSLERLRNEVAKA